MNRIHHLSIVSILAFSPGCAELQHQFLQADRPADCPRQTTANLAGELNRLDRSTDTQTLACAVAALHDSQDAALRGSSLGSRLSLYLAERETNQARREKLAGQGVAFAETALAQGADADGAVHYYLAANLGLAVREHMTLAVENLDRLEEAMQKALALSPALDDGGPMRLLGTLYLKAPAWPNGIGDLDKALELLEKAVKEHPRHPLNHLFYAQALWEEDDEANLKRVKTEFVAGEALLAEGDWGYDKPAWQKEFVEFARESGLEVSR